MSIRTRTLIGVGVPATVAVLLLTAVALWYVVLSHEPSARLTATGAGGTDSAGKAATALATGPDLLLPDLQTLPPADLYVQVDPDTGVREMRFSTTVVNTGEGPLEMVGTYDPAIGRTRAIQRMQSPELDGTVEQFVGDFVFHPGHSHWHFESFTEFELWTHDAGGELEDLIATTDKMTFCVMDSDRLDPPPAGAAEEAAFGGCHRQVQGLSVGWGDTYSATTTGQELDITDVPNGRYAIRSTADPENRLLETDEANNDAVVYVQLTGNRIQRLSGP